MNIFNNKKLFFCATEQSGDNIGNLILIKLKCDYPSLIIEGVGGILVPLNKKNLLIDLIKKFKFPVIVVSRSILGTINHTLMTLEILKKNKINIFGVILNNIKNKKEGDENAKSIEDFGNIKVLGQILSINYIAKKKIEALSKKKFINVFKL